MDVGTPLAVSGPLWTGPLHDRAFIERMAAEAAALGWAGHAVPLGSPHREKASKNNDQRPLEELLSLFCEEADLRLPPWYVSVDLIAKRLDRSPGRDEIIRALQDAGFAAARCHVDRKAVRTDASMSQIVDVARGLGYAPRPLAGGGGGGAAAGA